ncbi:MULTISPECIES: hypothetical protein [Pseudomonas]|nr:MULTISPECIES: hypothetical protein [Pseudomonas]MCL8306993.1 hypothetical protein [Pseudomonas putida]
MQTDSISPLAIIAIFAGIIEASALATLPFLSDNSQEIYTWFLVGFPFFLTMLFFLTLNFNNQSLYQPPQPEAVEKTDTHTSLARVPENVLSERSCPATPVPVQTLSITLSGPDTRKIIETHILHALTEAHALPRSWVLENLDTRVRIHLSVSALDTDEKRDPS